ncbi:hypothetical protein PILCRDRAFT_828428 [Piloderma croceum F 1598]|uniref:Uncharacterized protein n=1 Tax=Piloderma croceum (strain F 1598) TaxID=765440 RepID=A0A0C3BAA1_PILCF|nr:hypothetical protein PILCRDRAFT_828428 [Piloderma croceum F 1598]
MLQDYSPNHSVTAHSNVDSDPQRSLADGSSKTFRILLTGISIVAVVLLVAAGLLLQILGLHESYVSSGYLITSAPLGPTITIAHACSMVVSLTVPLVLGLAAYRLSRDWMAASHNGTDNRPTPFQLGMLMNVLYGANLTSLWSASGFMLGFGSASKAQPLRKPRMLRSAVIVAAFYLTLAYTCVISESWLSATSESVPFPRQGAYTGLIPQLTRQLNQTMCDANANIAVDIPYPELAPLCGMRVAGTGNGYGASEPEGIRTINNASALNSVAFADNQTALIVPATALMPTNIAFTASTYGVRSTCQSITSKCIDPSNPGPDAFLAINCSALTIFNFALPTTGDPQPFGVLNSSGQVFEPTDYRTVDTNPFNFAGLVNSYSYVIEYEEFTNNTGFFAHGESGAWNVLLCSATVVSATYRYTNGSYSMLSATPADVNMTKRITTMIGTDEFATRVPDAVEGIGLVSGDYVSSFSRELSRELIGMSASIYEPGPTIDLVQFMPGIGAKLQLVPLTILLVCLLIYSLTILPMTMLAATGSRSIPYVTLARERIINPLTVIHSAFEHIDARRTWTNDPEKLFSTAKEEDRLNVGPMLTDDGAITFGISRRRPA